MTFQTFPLPPAPACACLALLLLAACAEQQEGVASAGSRPLPHTVQLPPPAHVQTLPGIEGVIGADGRELVRQFGPARLDVREGDARKLQFSNEACVLDIYLYPAAHDGEPRATYVDARRDDGRDVDRARCIEALRRR